MAEPRKVASQISALASGLTGAEVAELGVGLVLDGCEKTARSGGPGLRSPWPVRPATRSFGGGQSGLAGSGNSPRKRDSAFASATRFASHFVTRQRHTNLQRPDKAQQNQRKPVKRCHPTNPPTAFTRQGSQVQSLSRPPLQPLENEQLFTKNPTPYRRPTTPIW